MLNGMGEMVKHAIIADRKFCIFLDDYIDSILALDEDILINAIKWSCTIKRNVVEADEKESFKRKILNLGHTIGHAIEKTMNYEIKHGEAVALGMIAETKIAENLGMCNTVMSKKIIDLITKPGFKSSLKGIDIEQVIRNTKYDKKNTAEKVRYVLPRKIADMAIDMEVSTEVIREGLGDMQ
jgi:3-dehydroquinate synthase